ncbi:phosphatase PAP2 family protein [Cellulomonas sp. URHD0024]|uniref:phosphatase PAP2 family protein n=1 Tax=Cellulomonas sp. URHD0024 TaxID=1302620 RepID=UPI0003FFFC8A|nr:phosphatase PAP2 family protein [Cellulomonas sp. URHD0024]
MAEPLGGGPPPAADGSTTDAREPVEDWLAQRIADAVPGEQPEALLRALRTLGRWDRRAYESVAGWSTPLLDEPMRLVAQVANHSKPWIATAAVLATFGGRRGRTAALAGLAAVAATSFVVNQPMKRAGDRRRPDRHALQVPVPRWVPMPTSTSFPSGHSASAAAFAAAVGHVLPELRIPLRGAAALVALSRVYTGVHYPGDVAVGAVTGAVVGRSAAGLVVRVTTSS